ncbi:beta-amyrin 28-monooxygenase-like isoform X1 [Nicotiana tomentosiformis]|uniref:beta-amyrin 28-monooxygenase-like isoform X1 n=1 Tax=Nicotiana tomentosiformis TaxID=4098 RepID=UPI00051AB569|nr:beta-amyrin 28-monooxygenase-like isoform X1 [Nicotiana tomentosiformis]
MEILISFSIFIASILSLLYLLNLFTRNRTKTLNLPPGSYGWPVIGETPEFLRSRRDGSPEKFVTDRIEKYQSQIFKTCIVGEKVAVLCGPAGNKFLFGNENKLVNVWWPSSVRQLLGSCLSTISGEEAKLMRKMLTYFVSPDAFSKLYIKTMELSTQQHIKNYWQGKEELKVFPTIKLHTFELACRLFMSLEDTNRISNLFNLFNIFLKGVLSLALNFPGTRFYHAKKATNSIRKELVLIVQQRREALEQKLLVCPPQDLLSHLLLFPDENGKFMSELELANNILLLLFAGHDTTSVTITLVMKYLGELPHVYDKVLQEQKEIASLKGGREYLNWDDMQKMKYTWDVVSEVLRLTSPITGSFREALVNLDYQGYIIPKGWKLYWNGAVTHMDPKFFLNTKNFDPSRFEGAGPTPFSYVPFGGGPRMCLGKEFARLEILVFIHNVVKDFRWKLLIPTEKIEYDPMPTPIEGLPVLLQPHNP